VPPKPISTFPTTESHSALVKLAGRIKTRHSRRRVHESAACACHHRRLLPHYTFQREALTTAVGNTLTWMEKIVNEVRNGNPPEITAVMTIRTGAKGFDGRGSQRCFADTKSRPIHGNHGGAQGVDAHRVDHGVRL